MSASNPNKRDFHIGLQPAQAWIAILGLVLVSALCILVHAGSILRLAFPLGAFTVGIFLYLRYPILYLGFTWWIWFLTPWLRRLVDYQSGWTEPSPILLAPHLVTLVTFATFVRHLPKSYRQGSLPFVMGCISVFYGFLVGLIKNPFTGVVPELLNWLTPVLFGFHLFVNWRDYPRYRQNFQRAFFWGVLVMGAYGVLQFVVAPGWDKYWMANAPITSIGIPEPFKIRVFSTMNAPGPFGVVMMAGLLLLFNSQGALRFPTAGFGYLTFLLSLSRAGWLGWFVGLLTFITSIKARLQMRLIVTILVMGMCVLPLTNMEPFSEVIHSRLQSLSNPHNDVSYNARAEGYNQALGEAFSDVIGKGLGSVDDRKNKYSIGVHDSTILEIFFSLGWIGSMPYLTGLVLLLAKLLQLSELRFDPFAIAARAICLGCFVQFGLGSVILGVSGIVLWGFLGIVLAANRYYQHQYANGINKG